MATRMPNGMQKNSRVLFASLTSGGLLWLAFPPCSWWLAAWVAPLGWLLLIDDPQPIARRGYGLIWATAILHWLGLLYGIGLAHPALIAGCGALAAYLAIYPTLFVGLSRVAVHRCRLPLAIAAPVVWVGLELARGHALTGFSMALLAHTQVDQTTVIQCSDLIGGYGLSFAMVFMSACLARAARRSAGGPPLRQSLIASLLAAAAILAVVSYGSFRLQEADRLRGAAAEQIPSRPMQVALIQGSFNVFYEFDLEKNRLIFDRYRELSIEAVRSRPDLDLLVWPESVFTGDLGELILEADAESLDPPPKADVDAEKFRRLIRNVAAAFPEKTREIATAINRPRDGRPAGAANLIVGTDAEHLFPDRSERFNSALLIGPAGEIRGRYYKMHRVVFGEYLPGGDIFPWLYDLTPMPNGLTAGRQPAAFPVEIHDGGGTLTLVPNICFESSVPHRIRGQIAALERAGTPPDVIVNVSNDGWFKGSTILDHHFACSVFRAVENRRPVLIAANTGFSAHIDGSGRILAKGPRRAESILFAEVVPDGRRSGYRVVGDLPSWLCAAACFVFAAVGVVDARRAARQSKSRNKDTAATRKVKSGD